jgi:hypothetical protein
LRPGRLAVAVAAVVSPVLAATAADAIAIARISFVDELVEVQSPKGWRRLVEGAPLRVGDRLRTGELGKARIDFPWMTVAVSGSSCVSVPDSPVLAMVLEAGRVEQLSPGGEMIKLLTGEALIRGQGHLIVRRADGRTLISVLDGSFRVESRGKAIVLVSGEGTVVTAAAAPRAPIPLPSPPVALLPGNDPVYVGAGEPVTLQFVSTARAHHLEILALGSSQPVIERDLASGPISVTIPPPGTYRWRVSSRDAEGLEGRPSVEGWLAVVAK